MLFRDETGCFWNQVDTAISPTTINAVLKHCSTVDLLFAMYASQNFEFFESLDKSFPYETHRQNLQNVLTVRPRLTVPGSAGFRFFGDHEWINRFLFPIAREFFLDDLKTLDATLATAIMNPGDVAEISNGEVKIRQQASPFSKNLEDELDYRFSHRSDPPAPWKGPTSKRRSSDRCISSLWLDSAPQKLLLYTSVLTPIHDPSQDLRRCCWGPCDCGPIAGFVDALSHLCCKGLI